MPRQKNQPSVVFRARQTFAVAYPETGMLTVMRGDEFTAADRVVKSHPEMFEQILQPGAVLPAPVPVVEQTTKAPGEIRTVNV